MSEDNDEMKEVLSKKEEAVCPICKRLNRISWAPEDSCEHLYEAIEEPEGFYFYFFPHITY